MKYIFNQFLKKAGLLCILSFFFGAAACDKNGGKSGVGNAGGPKADGPIPVEGFVVVQKDLQDHIESIGNLLPMEETALKTEASGKVTFLNLPEGKAVNEGELLLKIFDKDLLAQIAKLEAQLNIAKKNESRQNALKKIEGISESDYDQTVLQISNLQAEIKVIQAQLLKTEIKAPFDGVIGLKKISPGAYLTPNQEVATIRKIYPLKLDFSIPERYASLVDYQSKLHFTIESDTQKFEAHIQASEKSIDQESRNLNLRALVTQKTEKLIPGLFAKVFLEVDKKKKTLFVPTQSIIPMAREKKVVLFRNGKAFFQTIKTASRNAQEIEVVSGLQPGDTVITSGMLFLKPDISVRLTRMLQK